MSLFAQVDVGILTNPKVRAFARALGVSPAAVRQWRQRGVPAARVPAIANLLAHAAPMRVVRDLELRLARLEMLFAPRAASGGSDSPILLAEDDTEVRP